MPTVFSHMASGYVLSTAGREQSRARIILATTCAGLAALPDCDALFRFWIPYEHPLGHRGLTHSLSFAVIIGLAASLLLIRFKLVSEISFPKLWGLLSVVVASHGFFDSMTTGGLGVAFFAPFSNARYFLPRRPIPVAPFSLTRLFEPGRLRLFLWEGLLFWTFAIGVAVWSSQSIIRKALTVTLCAIGAIAWIVALS